MRRIRETIVVEGRDDTNSIKRAVDCETIETHGFGIKKETWDLLAEAYERTGLLIFTDPDHAGEEIRRRVLERFPDSKEAFIDRALATSGGDVGVENASPEAIRDALEKARATVAESGPDEFTMEDLFAAGLAGGEGSRERRRELGKALGIGFGNTRTFLRKLNAYGVTREEWEAALTKADEAVSETGTENERAE